MNNGSVKDNIRNFRKVRHVTQAEMAERLGISRTAYRNIESGETRLLSDNLDKIAGILQIDTDELVLGYRPQRKNRAQTEIEEKYISKIAELKKKSKEEIDALNAEVRRLKIENADLKKHISTLEDLNNTKAELIVMLKRHDLK